MLRTRPSVSASGASSLSRSHTREVNTLPSSRRRSLLLAAVKLDAGMLDGPPLQGLIGLIELTKSPLIVGRWLIFLFLSACDCD